MKYTILGYSQVKALELGLDVIDLSILRWLQDFYPSMSKKIIDGEEFVWIKYKHFIEDMPILGINSKNSLHYRLKKLEEIGLIARKCLKNKEGTFSMVRLTEMLTVLVTTKTRLGDDQDPRLGDDQDQNNPSTNINPSTKKLISKEEFIKSLEGTATYKEALTDWLAYRTKLKETKQWAYQANALAKFDNPRDIVDYCMGNGYQGLFKPRRNDDSSTVPKAHSFKIR